jgi:hypothetical protein
MTAILSRISTLLAEIMICLTHYARYITVLKLPPVTLPETAVRAAIAAEIKDAREKGKSWQTKAGKRGSKSYCIAVESTTRREGRIRQSG